MDVQGAQSEMHRSPRRARLRRAEVQRWGFLSVQVIAGVQTQDCGAAAGAAGRGRCWDAARLACAVECEH